MTPFSPGATSQVAEAASDRPDRAREPFSAPSDWPSAAVGAAERSPEAVAPPAGASASVRVDAWREFDAERRRPIPVRLYTPGVGDGPFPLVVFSPGLGRSVDSCEYLGRQWAAFGVASVHVGHAGSDEAAWRGSLRPKKTLREAFENPRNIVARPRDLCFVLDQLERMQWAGDPRAKRLDLQRIGAAGYDFGAQSVLALGGQILPGGVRAADARVRAVVAMSPPVDGLPKPYQAAFGDVKIPCLFITGTEDDGWVGTTTASQRRIPFDYSPSPKSYLVTLHGADHMVYAGHPVVAMRGRDDGKYQRVIAAVTTLFWQAHLGDDPRADAWLSAADSALGFGGLARWEVRQLVPAASVSSAASRFGATGARTPATSGAENPR